MYLTVYTHHPATVESRKGEPVSAQKEREKMTDMVLRMAMNRTIDRPFPL